MANSDPIMDGPPTKKAKIGGDANGRDLLFQLLLLLILFLINIVEAV